MCLRVCVCVCVAHIYDFVYYLSAAEGRIHENMDFVHFSIPSMEIGSSGAK